MEEVGVEREANERGIGRVGAAGEPGSRDQPPSDQPPRASFSITKANIPLMPRWGTEMTFGSFCDV